VSRGSLALLVLVLGCRREGIRGDDSGPLAPPVGDAAPTVSLLGRWRVEGTGRQFDVRAKDDTFTFHVVSPKEWNGAYNAEEIRFALRAGKGGYRVTDRYRPFAQPNAYLDDTVRAACTTELTADHEGKPLRARLVGADVLEVDFGQAEVALVISALAEVEGCKPPAVVGRLTAVLRRVK